MKSKDDDGIVKFLCWTYSLTGADLIRDRMLITGGNALMRYIVNQFQVQSRGLIADKEDDLVASDGKKKLPRVLMGRGGFDPQQF